MRIHAYAFTHVSVQEVVSQWLMVQCIFSILPQGADKRSVTGAEVTHAVAFFSLLLNYSGSSLGWQGPVPVNDA